jgi:hypothetical protein
MSSNQPLISDIVSIHNDISFSIIIYNIYILDYKTGKLGKICISNFKFNFLKYIKMKWVTKYVRWLPDLEDEECKRLHDKYNFQNCK